MRSEGRRAHGWKSLGKHQCDPSQCVSKGHCQLDLKEKPYSHHQRSKKLPKEIAHASRLALNEQYKVTKPNHVRSVNARIKVAVVTLIQAACGVSSKQQPCLLVFMPGQCTGAACPGSREVFGMAEAVRGCSAPKAGGEGAEPGKERLPDEEMLLG